MQYLKIIRQNISENSAILRTYWWVFLGMSLSFYIYQYLILKFIGIEHKYFSVIASLYDVLIHPIIILIIMYLMDCYNKKTLPVDFNRVMSDTKRCYLRILLIYLGVYLIRRYFGFGANIIVFFIMYIKLPFLEQEIYFQDSSIWTAIKKTYELTNKEITIKTLTVLIVMFLFIYLTIAKLSHKIETYDIQHKHIILNSIGVFKLAFFLFCKAVLTKLYQNLTTSSLAADKIE